MASMKGTISMSPTVPADLDDDDVDVLVGQAPDAVLDLVGHVRDDLHGAAQEVAAALLLDHGAVDRRRSSCSSAWTGSRR